MSSQAFCQPVEPIAEEARCSAVIARQFSLWPFGTRTLRLFLLLDPSRVEPDLQRGLLRAMQQAFARAETGSQTNAVRAAALAAHYVLQHHNREVLASQQVTASAVVASTRGRTAYVCLVGEAAAFAIRSGEMTGQCGARRLRRPLGLDQEPSVTLWSTPFDERDRLALVCGVPLGRKVPRLVADALAASTPDEAASRVTAALPGARVVITEAGQPIRGERRLMLVPRRAPPVPLTTRVRRLLAPVVPLTMLCAATLAVLTPTAEPPQVAAAQHAQDLMQQVDAAADPSVAHALASHALDLATRAAVNGPVEYAPLVDNVTRKLAEVDRVYPVVSNVAVRLGPGGTNVVDLAVTDTALYTLDPVESSVRMFGLDAFDQAPTPDTILMRKGAPIGARRLGTPVAMKYVAGPGGAHGMLLVVDDMRTVVQLGRDGSVKTQPVPSTASWQQLGALGADPGGNLFVLDSGAHRLLTYAGASQRLVDPPLAWFDPAAILDDSAWPQVAEVVPLRDLYVRLDDGRVRRIDRSGNPQPFNIEAPDGALSAVAAIASDGGDGLYLADPANARLVQVGADGTFVRQLRDPALAGVRQLQISPGGRRLYALIPSGVLAMDLPPDQVPPDSTE